MMTVHVSVPITRRKQFHIIEDEAGEVIYSTMFTSQLIDHLGSGDEREFLLSTGEHVYHITLQPHSSESENSDGQDHSPSP